MAGLTIPIDDNDPDYAPLVLGNYILGGAPLAAMRRVGIGGPPMPTRPF